MNARKHQLLATSALVGAGMALPGAAAAEMMKPALSVGGFFFHDTYFASQDLDEDKGSVAHQTDAEVHFKMAGELDNGLKIGGRIELEGTTQSAHKPGEVTLSDGTKAMWANPAATTSTRRTSPLRAGGGCSGSA